MSKILPALVVVLLTTVGTHAQKKSEPYQPAKDSANFFMQGKQYDKALASFKRSFDQGNINLYDFYNAACAAALTQKPDEAFAFLDHAIDRGYMDKPWAERDSDFNSLHNDNRWSKAMKKLEDQPRVMAQKFAAIKGKDPATLIPFKQKDLWGYLDKKSLRIIVQPEFVRLPFMNGCAEVQCYDGTMLWINPSGGLMEVVYRDRGEPAVGMVDDSELPHHVSSENGFKGFKMDENKRIIQFSDIYNRVQPDFFNIDGPILINGKYYAVVEKSDGSGIIDEQGNPLPGFDFVHEQLVWNRSAKSRDIWFYFENKDGKKGFINHKGDKKMEGELLSYALSSGRMFDYGIQEGKTTFGVIDLRKMEWVIKPQLLHIQSAFGTTKAACKKYTDERDDMVDVYFWVYDKGAEPDVYFIDRRLKVYKPKR